MRGGIPTRFDLRPQSVVLVVVLVAALTMGAATVVRGVCLDRELDEPEPGWCGTQIVDLLFGEDLVGGRLPYLDPCRPIGEGPCDEYPVLTMYAMRLGVVAGAEPLRYFYLSAGILTLAAIVTAWLLARAVGLRALYFAAAPTLLLHGLMNWDLIGVVLAVWGIAAFLAGRNVSAGVGMGLAIATKWFPVLLLLPMAADRWRAGRREEAVRLVGAAAAAWVVVNLPFALAARGPWSEFFRFNSSRPPDIDTPWFIVCRRIAGEVPCMPTGLVNLASFVLFVGAGWIAWRAVRRRDPSIRAWVFGFPLLALFFLSNKVYSPQYDLWLLPWFALSLPHPGLFAALSAAQVPVFLTRYADLTAPPTLAFHVAVLVRDAVLLLCVVAWVRGWAPREPELAPRARSVART